MPSIKDLWPDRWLKPAVLQNRTVRVAIAGVSVEPVYNPRTRRQEEHLIVAFHGKELRLIVNKTQAVALAAITRTEDYTAWPSHGIVLSVGKSPNGMDTAAALHHAMPTGQYRLRRSCP